MWLLVHARSTAGRGRFGGVTYSQRLHKDGGKPRPEGCDQANNQTEVLVEYSVPYLFLVPHLTTDINRCIETVPQSRPINLAIGGCRITPNRAGARA
ncbi:MAG: DUF3455 domain-containing protein [Beijerinckiaceae bacterium]